ncbi:MAG: hypothetical protein GF308_01310 [Candidatus Heimdallarchaeota archaeon]|nr:hypothetical protein [Candidatus Heimdallarchaeota archaeon]
MANKTLEVTEEVYQLLTSLKKEEESYGELLKRLVKGNSELLLQLWGKVEKEEEKQELEEIKKMLEELRNEERERTEE